MDESPRNEEFPSLFNLLAAIFAGAGAFIRWIGWPFSWPGRIWDSFWWLVDNTPVWTEWLEHRARAISITIRREFYWFFTPLRRYTAWTFATIAGTAAIVLMLIVQIRHVFPLQSQPTVAQRTTESGEATTLVDASTFRPATRLPESVGLDPRYRNADVPLPLQVRPRTVLPQAENWPPPFDLKQSEPPQPGRSFEQTPRLPWETDHDPLDDGPLDDILADIPLRTKTTTPIPAPRRSDPGTAPPWNLSDSPRDRSRNNHTGDPLDHLFSGDDPPPERRLPEFPDLPAQPAPWDIEVSLLPSDDHTPFAVRSQTEPLPERFLPRDPRWQLTAINRTDNRVEVPRLYRERWTNAEWEALQSQRRPQLLSSDLPGIESALTAAGISIERTGPPRVVNGQPATYRIRVSNTGGDAVPHIDIDHLVPRTHDVVDVDPPAAFLQGTLQWRLTNLQPGETRVLLVETIPYGRGEIETPVTAKVATSVSATTNVTSPPADPSPPRRDTLPRNPEPARQLPNEAEPFEPEPPFGRQPEFPPEPRRNPIARPVAPTAQLSLKVQAPDRMHVGQKCPIDFVVTNTGRVRAEGIRIRNTLPAGMTHRLGQEVEYVIGRLEPGQTQRIRLVPYLREAGTLTCTAWLQGRELRTEPVRESIFAYEPPLRLRRWGWQEIPEDVAVTFTNHVQNLTTREVRDVEVIETVPAGLEVIQVGDSGRFDPRTRQIRWFLDRVDAGATIKLHVTVKAPTAGRHRSLVFGSTPQMAAIPIEATVRTMTVSSREPVRPFERNSRR